MTEEMIVQKGKRTVRVRGPSVEKTMRTREQIIRAAMGEFLDKGYADATMAGIAARAGLAKGTTYRYFDTKEALFAGIVRDIVTSPLAGIDHQLISEDELVSTYCRRVMLPLMRDLEKGGRAQVARLALAESRAFPYLAEVYRTEVYDPFLARLRSLAETAAQRGELKCNLLLTFPHLLAAPLWMGIVHNRMLCPAEQIDAAALFEAQIGLLFK